MSRLDYSQRYNGKRSDDEDLLIERIVTLASQYGCYGYRRITAMLQREGWQVNHKRVERIWRQEGLKVPAKQPRRGRLWLNDGSCLRLRSEYPDHVWSYDFVVERTHDGCAFRILNVIDEYSRDCLAELYCTRGIPAHLRSDNGSEFIANELR
jgi:putative transposase